MGIFIGFIGVPGVGKSSVAIELAELLQGKVFIEPGEEAYPIDKDKPWQEQVDILESWVCQLNLKNFFKARQLADTGAISVADAGIFLVNKELIYSPSCSWWYGLIPNQEKERIYQNALSDWENAPCPDVLVLFETDENTWQRFLSDRGRSVDNDETNLTTFIEQKEVMELAAKKFAYERKVPLVKFNNEYCSPKQSASLLCEKLAPFLQTETSINNMSCKTSNSVALKDIGFYKIEDSGSGLQPKQEQLEVFRLDNI